MKVLGLTGGIATGKSTVARLLADKHGIPVVDADRMARDVVARGTPGLAAVVEAFGEEVLTDDGTLDRAHLRRVVMADPEARKTLEGITHPRIGQGIAEQLGHWAMEGVPLAAVEAALLVETGSYRLYDVLVVVAASEDTQIARVMARDGVPEGEARAVLAAQLPLADKIAVAHHVVHNDDTPEALEVAVDALVEALRADG